MWTKLTCAQGSEILNRFWNDISKEANYNPTRRFKPDFYIKEALGCHFGLQLKILKQHNQYKIMKPTYSPESE